MKISDVSIIKNRVKDVFLNNEGIFDAMSPQLKASLQITGFNDLDNELVETIANQIIKWM